MPSLSPKSSFARRLRQAREAAQISQKGLGIAAGLDKFIASTRVNRYEQGVHEPDAATGKRLAEALNLPLAYFYAEEDEMAEMIARFHRSDVSNRERALQALSPLN